MPPHNKTLSDRVAEVRLPDSTLTQEVLARQVLAVV
jgi:hypothetical protein